MYACVSFDFFLATHRESRQVLFFCLMAIFTHVLLSFYHQQQAGLAEGVEHKDLRTIHTNQESNKSDNVLLRGWDWLTGGNLEQKRYLASNCEQLDMNFNGDNFPIYAGNTAGGNGQGGGVNGIPVGEVTIAANMAGSSIGFDWSFDIDGQENPYDCKVVDQVHVELFNAIPNKIQPGQFSCKSAENPFTCDLNAFDADVDCCDGDKTYHLLVHYKITCNFGDLGGTQTVTAFGAESAENDCPGNRWCYALQGAKGRPSRLRRRQRLLHH